MTVTEFITILLSSSLLASVISSIVNYFINKWEEKSKRSSALKQKAYMRAIASIAGIAHHTIRIVLKNSSSEGVNRMEILSYKSQLFENIAPAMLVANQEVLTLLKKIPPIVSECEKIGIEVFDPKKKTEAESNKATEKIRPWRKKAEELENKIIIAMQKDLDLEV